MSRNGHVQRDVLSPEFGLELASEHIRRRKRFVYLEHKAVAYSTSMLYWIK